MQSKFAIENSCLLTDTTNKDDTKSCLCSLFETDILINKNNNHTFKKTELLLLNFV